MPKIARLKKGEAPTLLHTDFANEEVMVPLGALRNLEVSPTGTGKLVMEGEKAVLQLDVAAIAAASPIPLTPYNLSTGTTLRIGIRPGVINDNAGPHELSSSGPFTISATRYFFAKVTTDATGAITAMDPHHQSTLEPPAASDTVSYKYLGKAVVVSGAITSIEPGHSGSQNYRRVGFTGDYAHLYERA